MLQVVWSTIAVIYTFFLKHKQNNVRICRYKNVNAVGTDTQEERNFSLAKPSDLQCSLKDWVISNATSGRESIFKFSVLILSITFHLITGDRYFLKWN